MMHHRSILAAAAALLLLAAGADQAIAVTPEVGQPAPGFTGTTAAGDTLSLDQYRGKTVILEWTNHDCPYVRKHYGANLAVINIGGVFTTGPSEAAYVITDLVKPNAVIASHANEQATDGGKVIAGTRTDAFMKKVEIPVHVPLSGRTMSFDGLARCVSGC